jgi:hypothetical protein
VSGFFGATHSPGRPRRPIAWNLLGQYDSPGWLLDLRLSESGAGFDPQVGFLRRTDYRKVEWVVLHRYRPGQLLGIKELRPHVSSFGIWKPDGFLETGWLHLDNHLEWKNGIEVHTGINLSREGVREDFEIDPKYMISVEPGVYDNVETVLFFQTSPTLPVSGEARLVAGGFFGGHRVSPSSEVRVRLGEVLTGAVRWEYNRVHLPGGWFTVNLARLRLSYSFTPRTFVQALVQWNDRLNIWSTNLRLGWLRDANTGLFVVYNENRGIGDDDAPDPLLRGSAARDRRLTLKLSWLFDLL